MSDEIRKHRTPSEKSLQNLTKGRSEPNKLTRRAKQAINTMLFCTTTAEKIEAARALLFTKPEVYFNIALKALPTDINITKTNINENRFLVLLQDLRKNYEIKQ